MSDATFIAGDWGTTHLRLFLCDAHGGLLEKRGGPGFVRTQGEFARVFDMLTSDWYQRTDVRVAILSGMVGARLGWQETPYVAAPIDPEQLANAYLELRGGAIRLVPGLSCRNRLAAPDLLRGEETQVLGALQLHPELRHGRHLLCLPGTHTKWVLTHDGSIAEFLTAPVGELFKLIRDHSVLIHNDASSFENAAFDRGLAEVARDPHVAILHRLFQCRSRWMTGDLSADSTSAYLSGLLIGCDVHGAMDVLASAASPTVYVIGSSAIAELYSKGIGRMHRPVAQIEGDRAALAGLTHLFRLSTRAEGAPRA